jgi:small subunit ribosomal protein S16
VSLKIRLKRAGSKKRPFYRVVVTDSRKARDSRSIEDIGYYNPLEDPVVVNVDREKVVAWTDKGAKPSDTVRTLLRHENSVHPTRRTSVSFVEEAPVVREPKKKAATKGAKAAKAPKAPKAAPAAAVAVAEPVAKAPAAEAPAKEAPAKVAPPKEAPAAEAPTEEIPVQEVAAEEAPAAEAPAAEVPAEEASAEKAGDDSKEKKEDA